MIRQRLIYATMAASVLVLLLAAPVFAEDIHIPAIEPEEEYEGLVIGQDITQEELAPSIEDDAKPDWKDLKDRGPLGLATNRVPHDACEMCFTVPDQDTIDEYQIYEYIETDLPQGDTIIRRHIPNPAPGYVETTDLETGERIWYIGEEEYRGMTDEDKSSDEAPHSIIEMHRIHMRHVHELGSIPGVIEDGPDGKGFSVTIDPEHFEESRHLVPPFLEGVPVEVKEGEPIELLGDLISYEFRPLPSGAAIGEK